jgi:glycerol-3-phosphate dehydrogenase
VRPLISSGDPKKSVDISRRAELYETSSGMLTITGGKLTTFRRMAAQVVDRIGVRQGRDAECRTDDIPLGMTARPEDLETSVKLPEGATDQLAFRYGHAARAVLDVCEERPELAEQIVPGHPDLLAEVVVAARREQARSVADVLLRRTRLGLLAATHLRDADAVAAVAQTLGGELGWSERRVGEEAEAWAGVARAEGLDPARALAP